MGLTLRIENEPRLPDGGPLAYTLTGLRGADIGRDAHLDWSLPDASRHVSGKHCEIRCQDGGYLLYDVSKNGTFLNGSDRRVQSPHRLRSGDRLMIGHYIVAVDVTEESPVAARPPASEPQMSDPEDPWRTGPDSPAPPIDRRDLRAQREAVAESRDFLEQAANLPRSRDEGFVMRPAPEDPAPWIDAPAPSLVPPPPAVVPASWDTDDRASPPPAEPPPPVPTPRRRAAVVSPPPNSAWSAEASPWVEESDVASPPLPAARFPAAAMGRPAAFPEAPVAPPAVQAPASLSPPVGSIDLVGRFAKGAGLPPGTLPVRDAGDFAETIGRLMLIVADNLKQLLEARSQTKRIARASNQTMIAALDNNPLKFSPTAQDALRAMLNPGTSYLDADRALLQSFEDIKAHQLKTFSAMQRALGMLLEDMDPKSLEAGLDKEKGPFAWFGSRGARLWALYQSRWQSRVQRHGGGMQDLFMQYFAECYDQSTGEADQGGRARR